jgi:hypothetical protein
MLIDHLPVSLGLLEGWFHTPQGQELPRILMRWFHFIGGVTWIGLLYFFNLVNVPLQKGLDADTKKKVNPSCSAGRSGIFAGCRSRGAFRSRLLRYVYPQTRCGNAGSGHTDVSGKMIALVWLLIPIVFFFIEFLVIKKVPRLAKTGNLCGICRDSVPADGVDDRQSG